MSRDPLADVLYKSDREQDKLNAARYGQPYVPLQRGFLAVLERWPYRCVANFNDEREPWPGDPWWGYRAEIWDAIDWALGFSHDPPGWSWARRFRKSFPRAYLAAWWITAKIEDWVGPDYRLAGPWPFHDFIRQLSEVKGMKVEGRW